MTATDANSPQSVDPSMPGTTLLNGLVPISPYADVAPTEAEANRAGTSSACSVVASGGCAGVGASQPLTVDLPVADIFQLLMLPSPPIGSLPDSFGNYSIVLGFTGPAAACTAGPAGGPGSGFTATQTLASGTVDIRDGNSSLIGGAKQISNADVLSGLPSGTVPPALLSPIPANTVDVTVTPGSTNGAGSGPASTATAGQLALQVDNMPVLSLIGGKVSCGANQPTPTPTGSSSSPASPPGGQTSSQAPQGAGTSTPPGAVGSSSEIAMHGGIQSDEGRYVPASNDTPLWAGLVSGGAALAGGIALWQRRLRRS